MARSLPWFFLLHNHNPARWSSWGIQVSLALGARAWRSGHLERQLVLPLLVLTLAVGFFETLSVIIQVSYYKATKGPRRQRQAVLLRWLLCTIILNSLVWSESQVVLVAYLVTAGPGCFCFIYCRHRDTWLWMPQIFFEILKPLGNGPNAWWGQ